MNVSPQENVIQYRHKKNDEQEKLISQYTTFIPCFKSNKKYKLNTQEIHSAYCNMSGTHLVTREGEYHTNLTLKKVAELSHLMYCNRSHLVNYAHIRKIEQLENGCGKAYIHNEDSIPISRNRMKSM
jgi:DNA-binding LytR/AlgR family response regulator